MTNFIDKGRTEPFPKFQTSFGVPPAENCDKLYWKRKDRTVPKDPRSFRSLTVICDDVPPERIIYLESIRKVRRLNREPWLNTSKKARLNRCHSPKPLFRFSEQKMVTNDIEKEMTPLFLKTQASFRFPSLISVRPNRELWLITWEKKRPNRAQRLKPHVVKLDVATESRDSSHRQRKDWTVPKDRSLVLFPFDRELLLITAKKKRLNRSQRPKPHFVSSQQRTVTDYMEKEKTEPFPKTQASCRFIPTENCD